MNCPQGPYANPRLPDGVYDATIQEIAQGKYGRTQEHVYVRIVLWLPVVEKYFCTNLYFPTNKPNDKSIKRLAALCQCIGGLSPQDIFECPKAFEDRHVRVEIRTMPGHSGNAWQQYRDVHQYLPMPVIVNEPSPEKTAETPKQQTIIYEMIEYDD